MTHVLDNILTSAPDAAATHKKSHANIMLINFNNKYSEASEKDAAKMYREFTIQKFSKVRKALSHKLANPTREKDNSPKTPAKSGMQDSSDSESE